MSEKLVKNLTIRIVIGKASNSNHTCWLLLLNASIQHVRQLHRPNVMMTNGQHVTKVNRNINFRNVSVYVLNVNRDNYTRSM